jgi:DNA primase
MTHDISRVREATSMPDLAREYGAALRRVPGGFSCRCLFHEERTASMRVNVGGERDGSWKCFGCGAGGNCFDFVIRLEGWGFGKTLRYLADRAGVVISGPPPQLESAARAEDRDFLRWVTWKAQQTALGLLDAAVTRGDDDEWCECLGRLSRHEVRSTLDAPLGSRRAWRQWAEEEQAFASAWMSLAVLSHV